MLERWPFLLLMVGVLGPFLFWNLRQQRIYRRFFNPAIEHAEESLRSFAHAASARYQPSADRWPDLVPWLFSFRSSITSLSGYFPGGRPRALPGDGGVQLQQDGFTVHVGWIVVALEDGLSLLPRIRVELPPRVAFRGLQGASRLSLFNPWDLWSRNVYVVTDRSPRFELTPREQVAFDALTPHAVRIVMYASTPPNPLTGALPDPYALYIEVWGVGTHAQKSEAPTEATYSSWRDDFRLDDLRALVSRAVQLAKTASLLPQR